MSETHVKGLADLQKFLDELPAKLERNVMRGALRAGATQELLPEAQANLLSAGAVKTGELIAGLKVKTGARGGRVTASVVATGKHAYIARFLEYGVKSHLIAAKNKKELFFAGSFIKSVRHPGIRAKGYMRRALDGRAQQAVIAAGNYIKNRLATKQGLDTSAVLIEGDQA